MDQCPWCWHDIDDELIDFMLENESDMGGGDSIMFQCPYCNNEIMVTLIKYFSLSKSDCIRESELTTAVTLAT